MKRFTEMCEKLLGEEISLRAGQTVEFERDMLVPSVTNGKRREVTEGTRGKVVEVGDMEVVVELEKTKERVKVYDDNYEYLGFVSN